MRLIRSSGAIHFVVVAVLLIGAGLAQGAVPLDTSYQGLLLDSVGIPLDGPLDVISTDLRQQLHLDRFGSSASTPDAGAVKRVAGSALRPLVRGMLWLAGVWRRRSRAD